METNISKPCPVCKTMGQNIRIWDYGERIDFECERCGKFTITRTAASILQDKQMNYKLSAWIRQNQNESNILEIHSRLLREIESQLPIYTPPEKQNILLQAFGRRAKCDGNVFVVKLPNDIPLAWAINKEEFLSILRCLIDTKLVRRIERYPSIEDANTITLEITGTGWEKLEQIDQIEKITTFTTLQNQNVIYDIFISYASEDKESIARPLYLALMEKGLTVWFDDAVLKIGDTLRRKIDDGLRKCRYGVVILSPNFLSKEWPQRELDGLLARETTSGKKAILPIWHKIDRYTLLNHSPTLADRLAGRSDDELHVLVDKICQAIE